MAKYLYLLDANILSDLIKNPAGSVAVKIAAVGESSVCTSIAVAGELRYGAVKKVPLSFAQKWMPCSQLLMCFLRKPKPTSTMAKFAMLWKSSARLLVLTIC